MTRNTNHGFLALALAVTVATPAAAPPAAKKATHMQTLHGDQIKDDYFWLRERENPEVKAYLLCHKKNKRPDGTPAGSCVGIMLAETEQNVADRLFAQLDKPGFLEQLGADDNVTRREQITAALGASDAKRAELAEMWAAGDLTSSEWQTARRAQAEAEQTLRAELAAVPPPVSSVGIADARASWPDMTLGERREFLRLFIAKVTVNRARPGTKGFDEGRVVIEWRKR